MYFLLEFFDIIVYLTMHLVREVKLCGPIYFRGMYPFKRFLKDLKGNVRNKNRPECSIVDVTLYRRQLNFAQNVYPMWI